MTGMIALQPGLLRALLDRGVAGPEACAHITRAMTARLRGVGLAPFDFAWADGGAGQVASDDDIVFEINDGRETHGAFQYLVTATCAKTSRSTILAQASDGGFFEAIARHAAVSERIEECVRLCARDLHRELFPTLPIGGIAQWILTVGPMSAYAREGDWICVLDVDVEVDGPSVRLTWEFVDDAAPTPFGGRRFTSSSDVDLGEFEAMPDAEDALNGLLATWVGEPSGFLGFANEETS